MIGKASAVLGRIRPWQIDTTEEALYRDQLAKIKASTESRSTLTDVLDVTGHVANLASQITGNIGASQMAGKIAKLPAGSADALKLQGQMGTHNALNSGFNVLSNIGNLFALGYPGGMPVQGYAEGGEVMQSPDGTMQEIQGPSHEAGGVPIQMDPLVQMYSNRVKIDGLSIADRNKRRVKRNVSLAELLSRNLYDTTLIKSWERGKENHKKLQEQELQLQNKIWEYTQI